MSETKEVTRDFTMSDGDLMQLGDKATALIDRDAVELAGKRVVRLNQRKINMMKNIPQYIKTLLLVALTTAVIITASCTKTPVACFTIDKGSTNTKVNEEIQFSSCSTNADSFDWEFGDGETAKGGGTTVKHKYTKAGTYNVKLHAANKDKSDEITKSLTITQ